MEQKCSECNFWGTDKADVPCMACEFHSKWEPVFEPEYFSGLNWREAEKLVGKEVEYSEDGENWKGPDYLYKINPTITSHRYVCGGTNQVYIRTCPETHQHPTITIGGVELPRPEVEAPEEGTIVFTWRPDRVTDWCWSGCGNDSGRLRSGRVHLTEDRAQEWADWWQDTVVKVVQG